MDPEVCNIAKLLMMTVDWSALGCVGWFPYSWDTVVVHPLKNIILLCVITASLRGVFYLPL